jgi:hypothetical protein
VPANLVAFDYAQLLLRTKYCYRVRATGIYGPSAWSASVCAWTGPDHFEAVISSATPYSPLANGDFFYSGVSVVATIHDWVSGRNGPPARSVAAFYPYFAQSLTNPTQLGASYLLFADSVGSVANLAVYGRIPPTSGASSIGGGQYDAVHVIVSADTEGNITGTMVVWAQGGDDSTGRGAFMFNGNDTELYGDVHGNIHGSISGQFQIKLHSHDWSSVLQDLFDDSCWVQLDFATPIR